jgi:hypothetical protein
MTTPLLEKLLKICKDPNKDNVKCIVRSAIFMKQQLRDEVNFCITSFDEVDEDVYEVAVAALPYTHMSCSELKFINDTWIVSKASV